MVDQFQKQYESLQIPFPADNYTSIIEAKEKELVREILFVNTIKEIIENYVIYQWTESNSDTYLHEGNLMYK